jgi:hypothetical protein
MNTVRQYLDIILDLPTHFFVDIGASDCPGESQTETLLEHGWSGVMFECDPVKFYGLSKRMQGKSVKIIQNKVTVDNVLEHLKDANVPNDFYLSLDIDGYDYFVLRKILSVYKPQLIISEINEKIPPPIQFTVLYDPNYWWKGWHHFGYSLSMLENVLPEFGYKILELDFNNVLLVPGTQTEELSDVYWNGYLGKPDKNERFYYNTDFGPIYKMTLPEQIDFINNKFKDYQGQYAIHGRVQIQNTGQIKLTQDIGQWISKYAEDTRFQKYLEIGTWNGHGSTCCFYDGFSKRTDNPTLQSYEINESRFKEAQKLWKLAPEMNIIHGRILKDTECPTYREVNSVHSEVNTEWHKEDICNFWSCPYVPPNQPEVILLDGAEYLTYFEFEKFRHMESVQVFILDNIETAKNPHAYKVLSDNPDWKLIVYGTERNGWAIFEKVSASSEETLEIHVDLEE